jgi:hypothetical protein
VEALNVLLQILGRNSFVPEVSFEVSNMGLDRCLAMMLVGIAHPSFVTLNVALQIRKHLSSGRLVGAERDAPTSAVCIDILTVPLRSPLLQLVSARRALGNLMALGVEVANNPRS